MEENQKAYKLLFPNGDYFWPNGSTILVRIFDEEYWMVVLDGIDKEIARFRCRDLAGIVWEKELSGYVENKR